MLMVISPAKNLDESPVERALPTTEYDFAQDSQQLIDILKTKNEFDLMELMKISSKLANLNMERYQNWQWPFPSQQAKAAVMLFKGDVYQGLDAASLDDEGLQFAQQHLRILSGLYGLLRPLDLILPYRLEMGTRLDNPRGKNLYEFWGDRITRKLNEQLAQSGGKVLVNLASMEYFKAVQPKQLDAAVITPVFKDWKKGQYKIISFYAKKARGLMVRYAIDHKVSEVADLKGFDYAGYGYDPSMSTDSEWVFTRRQEL